MLLSCSHQWFKLQQLTSPCLQSGTFPFHLTRYLSPESQYLHLKVFVSLQAHCAGVQSQQNNRKCCCSNTYWLRPVESCSLTAIALLQWQWGELLYWFLDWLLSALFIEQTTVRSLPRPPHAGRSSNRIHRTSASVVVMGTLEEVPGCFVCFVFLPPVAEAPYCCLFNE